MATIGYATLQIIPSLKGVTDAIEKQIDGKVVNVTIEPKVDRRAADKAGQQAKQTVEQHTKQVRVEPTADTKAAQKAGKDISKTVNDEIKSAAKSSPGKDAAKAIVDGIADGVKQEMPRGGVGEAIVDGIADGVKQGIDGVGIGGEVVNTINTGIKSGNLGGTIRDAVIPAIKNIGQEIRSGASTWASGIGDALRSGDIQGATSDIATTVQGTTDLIADIGSTFGLQLDGVRQFGETTGTTLSQVGGNIQDVINTAGGVYTTLDSVGNLLEKTLPGKAGTGAAGIARALGAVAVPAWLLYLVAEDRGGRTWGNGDPVSSIPNRTDFTPGQRSNNEILYGPYVGPWLDKTFGITPPPGQGVNIPGGGGPNASAQRRGKFGYGSGGYTGSMPADKVAGVVHGGEYVIKASSTAGIENAMPGLLDYLNNRGALPGFAGGGKVALGNISAPGITTAEQQSMWDAVRGNFPSAILSSATRTVMTEGHPDYHNAGRAIDISGPGMGAIASWIASNYPDSLELIHSPFGNNIKNGKNVGDGTGFYGANLMAAHRDHVHWALGKTAINTRPSQSNADSPAATTEMLSTLGLGAPSPSEPVTSAASSMSVPGSLSGIAGMGLENLGSGVGKTTSGTDLSDISKAGAAAVTGQVGSALSLFGVNDSPGWLKGLSMFASGMSFGGDGASAAPMSAASTVPAANPAGMVHGGSGAAPGPVVNYNIRTATVEDAWAQAQRREKERAAATLARY